MKAPAQRKKENKANRTVPDAGQIEGTEILDPPVSGADEDTVDDPPGRRRPALEKKRDGSKTMMDRVESLFRMASLLAITASVVLAVFQFYQNGVANRKEASVDLMTRWQGSDERDALARLSADLEQQLETLGVINGQVTPAAMLALKAQIGQTLIEEWKSDPEAQSRLDDIDALFNFYSEVEFCIRAELCQAPLLHDYFGTEATGFWEYFRPYAVAKQNSFFPHYGKELEAFVNGLSEPDA